MDKIYLVTSGDYSDYSVNGVFTSKELAKGFMSSFGNTKFIEFRIEEYKLNPFEIEIKKGYHPFFVRMRKDGSCVDVRESSDSYGLGSESEFSYGFDVNKSMYCDVFAKDANHAIKIVNEKRTELIALDRWGNEHIT